MKYHDNAIPLVCGIILGLGLVYITNKETKIDKLKKKGIKQAEEITINHFKKLLDNNNELRIEEAILDFEKSQTPTTLEEFAKKKHRTKETYIKAYNHLFIKAKHRLNISSLVTKYT